MIFFMLKACQRVAIEVAGVVIGKTNGGRKKRNGF